MVIRVHYKPEILLYCTFILVVLITYVMAGSSERMTYIGAQNFVRCVKKVEADPNRSTIPWNLQIEPILKKLKEINDNSLDDRQNVL